MIRLRSHASIASIALAAACARPANVCELEFAIRCERPAGPAEVGAAVVTVHERLKPLAGRRGLETTSRGYDAILVRLGFEPDEAALAAIRARVERRGALELLPVIDAADAAADRERLDAWRGEHPDGDVSGFDALAPDAGGPSAGRAWFPFRNASEELVLCDVGVRADPERYFSERDLWRISPGTDASGFPAVRFAVREDRREAFGRFTQGLVGRQLAVLLDGGVVTAPEVRSALTGESIIEGRFDLAERDALLDVLRSTGIAGRLPFDVELSGRKSLK